MIITKNEFKEMGFDCTADTETLVEGCIKRAEYILNAVCGGTLNSAAAQSKSNLLLIKQAAAFQTDALLKDAQSGDISRVTLGDLSYSQSDTKSSVNVPETVKRLLKAAGCFYGTATEVVE